MEKLLLLGAGALAADLIDLFGAAAFVGAYVDPAFQRATQVDGVTIQSDWASAVSVASHYVLASSSIEHRARCRVIPSRWLHVVGAGGVDSSWRSEGAF